MGAFTKVFLDHDLYNTTEEEMNELENWPDDETVRNEAKGIFRPLFDSIQREKTEARQFSNNIVIRIAKKKDYPGLIILSKRVSHTCKHTGIISFNERSLDVRFRGGIVIVATTQSGFIVGASSFLIDDVNGNKCGYEFLIMVSQMFQRKGIGRKLFDATIDWAQKHNLSHINSTTFSDEGYELADSICKNRKDLECAPNRFGVSSFIIK
jgi:GNAT superfamily N-acetyltransferase